ncbi:hypothetical protein L1887_25612 [Cichorium endivia]|nr:hypothetical protein L1887_25612 [Cichorium endivia]
MRWNISGNICSGAALDNTDFDSGAYNPAIKCDCNIPNSTTCHITRLKVYAMDVVGPIPEGLWTLIYLTNLNLAQNYLTGPLSPSIGNLTRMQWLNLDINALSGQVPPELGQLTDLRSLSFGTNIFSGSLPSQLGNLRRLETIYMNSAGLGGEIPPSFANLRSMKRVWASDNNFTGRIPDFIGNWSQLVALRFEGNSFEGSIPPSFSRLALLQDLRISGLSNGTLDFIRDLKSLSSLVLRSNRISGFIPSDIGEYINLTQLDLSFNNLSGPIPRGLFSLSGIYVLFLGNNSLTGTLPDVKSITLRNIDLSYNELSGTLPSWANDPTLQLNIVVNNFTLNNTGLNCLQRGFPCDLGSPRYSSFAINCEIVIEGSARTSLDRRVFDIYIQGNRVFENFDIKWEARGESFTRVSREVTVEVSNNYIEIHLLWTGKGTSFLSVLGTFGPLISAIDATRYIIPNVSNNPPSNNNPLSNKKNNTGLIVGILVTIAVVSFFMLIAMYILMQRRKRKDSYDNYDEEFLGIDAKPYMFGYGDLRNVTDDFSPANKLGEGGFGPVYKGTLEDGRVIAVKQLSISSHQGKSQFVAEIATVSAVQHRNLVKLYGCCIDGERRLLVYEYLENKSLDQALFGSNKLSLTWTTRFEICMGVARGLAYLHEESRLRIIHRDVKSSNVLLDSDLNPKISDFGLAKLYDDKKTHLSTRVAGTFGYLAPEYAMWGHLTEKVDVFGFGVVALEIISGRPNSDLSLEDEKIYILRWAWKLHEANRELELVDEELSEFDEIEVRRMMRIALLCTQTSSTERPSMSRVVAMLSGDLEVSGAITRPEYLTCFAFDNFGFDNSTTFKSATPTSIVSPCSPHDSSQPMLHAIM